MLEEIGLIDSRTMMLPVVLCHEPFWCRSTKICVRMNLCAASDILCCAVFDLGDLEGMFSSFRS